MIMILNDNQKLHATIKRLGMVVGHGEADRTVVRRKTRRTAARAATARRTALCSTALSIAAVRAT